GSSNSKAVTSSRGATPPLCIRLGKTTSSPMFLLLLVHPGLLWVKIESGAIEVDGGFEVVAISVAADAAFDGHDLAVDSFGDCRGNSVSAVADHVGQPLFDGLGHFLQRQQLRMDDAAIPSVEVQGRG